MDRRGFLSFLLGLGLSGAFQCFFSRKGLASGDPAEQLCRKLRQVYDCLESASAIGREYLRIVPEEAHNTVLLDHICRRSALNRARLMVSDVPATRDVLRLWIRKDFEQGRTVLVNGWLLSQTEIRLCALTAIST